MLFFLFLVLVTQVVFFSGIINVVFKSSSKMLASVLPSILALETNLYRNTNNTTSLAINPLLSKAAELKAKDMAQRGYFSHVSPEGDKPWVWFEKVGYTYTYAGENLAVNFTDSKDVTSAWIKSQTHRDNMINQNFTETGIGVAEGIYENKPTTFVVQFFGTPNQPEPIVVPIKVATKVDTSKLKGSKVATAVATSGSVLGLYTNNAPENIPTYTTILVSPRHVMNNILIGISIFFVLILLISFVHTAKGHAGKGIVVKMLHSFSAHKKIIYKVLFFVIIMFLIWALDYYMIIKDISVDGGIISSI